MIGRDEITRAATELSVRPADVERDYVNSWLLAYIFRHPWLSSCLVLKGGNALRKGYFPNTRYSKDLDFSSPGAVDKALLTDAMKTVCDQVSAGTGIQFDNARLEVRDKERVSRSLEVLEVRAYFTDFAGESVGLPIRIFMDVTQWDVLLRPVAERALIHPYSDVADVQSVIRCVALEEILASKLKCLVQREHAPDLYDYVRWLLVDEVPVDRGQILGLFLRKTIYGEAPGVAFELLSRLPFAVLEAYWPKVDCPIASRLSFAEAVQRFLDHLAELFGDRRHQRSGQLSFVNAEQRALIMSAGRRKQLMALRYDGVDRVVEPYSIKFYKRQEGGGGEYFWVHDLIGGTSGPGTKRLVPEKIQNLKKLEKEFVPRYDIEVTKAGDIPEVDAARIQNPKPFIPGFGIARRKMISPARSSPRYRVHCGVCGRRFSRTTPD